jgi:excisionase family DNA binding protein
MINTKELTEYLKVHENTIYAYIKKGLPHYRIGKELRFELEEVKEWLKNRTNKDEKNNFLM